MYYDLPPTRNLRSTSFGFGKKQELANITCSPAPNRYDLYSDFDNKDKIKGYSLALGRDVI